MIKKFIVSIFCMLVVVSGFSFGGIAEQNNKIILSENSIIEVIPIEKNDYALNAYANPIVNITSPKNGTVVTSPYVEVMGYAYDSDGLKFGEFYHFCNSFLYYYENTTFPNWPYISFRGNFTNLPIGTHKFIIIFYDIYNNSGSDSVTVFYYGNLPPEKPTPPSGPTIGYIGVSYNYSTSTTDPNNDTIKYGWDWNGDGTVDQWTPLLNPGMTISTAHTFTSPGTYTIKVMAEDEHRAQSIFSDALSVNIMSNPPNKPTTPTGSSSGKPGTTYTYWSSAVDPDGDRVSLLFDWGDGSTSGWIGAYESGQTISASYIWHAQGSYTVKVKAKDTTGAESVWSNPLPITMPYSYTKPIPQFLELLFYRFPNAFPLLPQLMGY